MKEDFACWDIGFCRGLPKFRRLLGMLRSVGWLNTDVSGLPIGSIFKGQVSKKKAAKLKDFQSTVRCTPPHYWSVPRSLKTDFSPHFSL